MGCVISREVSSGIVSEVKEEKNLSVGSNKKVDEASTSGAEENAVEAQNGEKEKGAISSWLASLANSSVWGST